MGAFYRSYLSLLPSARRVFPSLSPVMSCPLQIPVTVATSRPSWESRARSRTPEIVEKLPRSSSTQIRLFGRRFQHMVSTVRLFRRRDDLPSAHQAHPSPTELPCLRPADQHHAVPFSPAKQHRDQQNNQNVGYRAVQGPHDFPGSVVAQKARARANRGGRRRLSSEG